MWCFYSLLFRAEKRSARRHSRLRALEEEAAAAQQALQSMNKMADDLTKKNEVSVFGLIN